MNDVNEQTGGNPFPLLAHSCDELMQSFYGCHEQVRALMDVPAAEAGIDRDYQALIQQLGRQLGGAVTALQFQDMASQLINHTHQRLRSCADQIARVAMGDDEDGEMIVSEAPLRPNPVTQDEMDAGSITLF